MNYYETLKNIHDILTDPDMSAEAMVSEIGELDPFAEVGELDTFE